MDLFQRIKKTYRERAAQRAHRHARFSPLFLVTFLVLFLVIGIACVSVINKAHASSTGTNTVPFSNLTMFDHQHGWAFNSTNRHVFTTHQGPEHWSDVTPSLLITQSIITTTFFQNATHAYIGVLQGTGTLLLSTQDSGRTWQQRAFTIPGTEPGDVGILQITFLDLNHGWLSFVRDQIAPGLFDFVLMSTSDGGKTWQTVLDTHTNSAGLGTPYSQSLHFTFSSPQKGWALASVPAPGVIYLYTTSDGGKTWRNANVPPVKGGEDINFTQDSGPFWQNSQQGMLYVNYDSDTAHVTTYRTLDGGKSWLLGPSTPSTSFQEFLTQSILNARTVWSFGFDGAGNYIIHQTSDEGLTWKTFQPTGLIPGDANNMVLLDIDFINSTTGWLTLQDAQGNIHLYQTTTAGHTWYALNPVA